MKGLLSASTSGTGNSGEDGKDLLNVSCTPDEGDCGVLTFICTGVGGAAVESFLEPGGTD